MVVVYSQHALAGTSSKELEDSVGATFTARMPLLTATRPLRLGIRRRSFPQQCYLCSLHVISASNNGNNVSVLRIRSTKRMRTNLHFNFLLERRHTVQHAQSDCQLAVDLAQVLGHLHAQLVSCGRISLTQMLVAVDGVQAIFLHHFHVALQCPEDPHCLAAAAAAKSYSNGIDNRFCMVQTGFQPGTS